MSRIVLPAAPQKPPYEYNFLNQVKQAVEKLGATDYLTTTSALALFSAGPGISYDATTGVISATGTVSSGSGSFTLDDGTASTTGAFIVNDGGA